MFKALLLAVVITFMCGLIYGTVQQSYRQGANDPQIQLAEDSTAVLNSGVSPQSILGNSNTTDISKSLAPFIIIVDGSDKVVAATAQLDGQAPVPPTGALDYAKAHGENRLTWQPKNGVRIASVIRPYSNKDSSGYVLVGRSLREVEKREKVLTLQVLMGWVASLIVIAIAVVLMWFRRRRHHHHHSPLIPESNGLET